MASQTVSSNAHAGHVVSTTTSACQNDGIYFTGSSRSFHVEYPSPSNTHALCSISSTIATDRGDRPRAADSSEHRMSMAELTLHFQSNDYAGYTTAAHASEREGVGLEAHYPTRAQAGYRWPQAIPRRQLRNPPRQDVQTAPEQAGSSLRTRWDQSLLSNARRLQLADDAYIAAVERNVDLACGDRLESWIRLWFRNRFAPPPPYQESSYRTTYLPRLLQACLNYEFGLSVEDNVRAVKARVQPGYWEEFAAMLMAASLGASEEGRVRRVLIDL